MSADNKYCSYCNSEEGKPRPIGNYEVVLRSAMVDGEVKYACQSCMMTNKSFLYALRDKMEAEGKTTFRDQSSDSKVEY